MRQRGSQLYVALGAVLVLALLVAAFAWYVGKVRAEAHEAGETAERARWQARESEELRRVNVLLVEAQLRAAALERQAAEDLAAAERRRLKEVADAEARKEGFIADVVAGRIRLFDPCRAAAGKGAGGDPEGGTSAPAPGSDAEADLRRAYAERVGRSIQLADEADALIVEAQGVITTYRKACR